MTGGRVLRVPMWALHVLAAVLAISCSDRGIVEEHFLSHGMSYPIDTSSFSVLDVRYVGIRDEELLEPGAREYVEKGIMFAQEYFRLNDVHEDVPGGDAAVISDPVLFRDDSGEIGLMVKVVVYGSKGQGRETGSSTRWVGSDKKIWRSENFAYFGCDSSLMWHYGGMVYK